MGEAVTRAEFDALVDIVHDLAMALVSHSHGVSDRSSYGGSTYGPDDGCYRELTAIRDRLADLAPTDPASPLSRGEGE